MDEILSNRMKHCFKIVIAGDGGTGKSTLLATKQSGKFSIAHKITIGVDFEIISMTLNNKNYNLQIWDLGGQERFQFIHDLYLKGAQGGILLYDLTRPQTFDHLTHWIELFHQENPKIPLILAGTKKDLVTPEETTKFSTKWIKLAIGLNYNEMVKKHLFISSKNLEGIDTIFSSLLDLIHSNSNLAELQAPLYSYENCI